MSSIAELRQQEFNMRLGRLPYAQKQSLVKKTLPSSFPLHVVYILTHTAVCGGVKVILEHAHYLTLQGVQVTLVSHFSRPTWFDFTANYLEIPFGIELTTGIPPCDLIIATYWDHIQACIETHIAPVIYFEQGDYHLFDRENIDPFILHFINTQFALPPFIITVSHKVSQIIDSLYHIKAAVYPNAINTQIFNLNAPPYISTTPYLLIMGSDDNKSKGLDEILEAYSLVKTYVPNLGLVWITPYALSKSYSEPTEVFVSPPQPFISSLYRGSFAFISASHYESFSLPVLEAMSCGCPVITTNNAGVTEYAVNLQNCLYTPINQPTSLAQNILHLLYNPLLRDQIIRGGLQTAKKYTWSNTISHLLTFYESAAQYEDSFNKSKK